MKKFGVSAVVALLICFVISLSACASSGLGFYVGDYKSQSIKKLSSFSMLSVSGEFEEGEGSLIAFSRERVDGEGSSATAYKVITVYDCTQDKVVGTYEVNKATHDIGVLISKVYDNTVYVIATINTATYEGSFVMYNSNGENLLSTDFSSMSSAYNLLDVIVMESGAYRVQEDGKVVKIFDTSDMTDYNYDIICKIGDYYYAKRTSYSAPVLVLDSNFNILHMVNVPNYATSSMISYLSNGNVLMQYVVEEMDDADEYDVIVGGEKFSVYTKVLNVKSGEWKNVDTEYVFETEAIANGTVAMGSSGYEKIDFEKEGLSSSIKNIVMSAHKIENKRIQYDANSSRVLSISDNGSVEEVLEPVIAGQVGMPERIAEDRYLVSNSINQYYLVNGKKEIIGQVRSDIDVSSGFIVSSTGVYDLDLNKIVEINADMRVEKIMNNALILKETEDSGDVYYLLKKGENTYTKIDGYDGCLGEGLYVVKSVSNEGKTLYTYYSEDGKSIITTEVKLTKCHVDKDGNIIAKSAQPGAGGVVEVKYYKFS